MNSSKGLQKYTSWTGDIDAEVAFARLGTVHRAGI